MTDSKKKKKKACTEREGASGCALQRVGSGPRGLHVSSEGDEAKRDWQPAHETKPWSECSGGDKLALSRKRSRRMEAR